MKGESKMKRSLTKYWRDIVAWIGAFLFAVFFSIVFKIPWWLILLAFAIGSLIMMFVYRVTIGGRVREKKINEAIHYACGLGEILDDMEEKSPFCDD